MFSSFTVLRTIPLQQHFKFLGHKFLPAIYFLSVAWFISWPLQLNHIPYMPYSSYRPILDHQYWVPSIIFGSRRKASFYSQHLLPSPTHTSAHTAFRISLALHHASKSTFLPDKTHFLKCNKVSLSVSKNQMVKMTNLLLQEKTHFAYTCSRWSKSMLCFNVIIDLPETVLCPTHCCFY